MRGGSSGGSAPSQTKAEFRKHFQALGLTATNRATVPGMSTAPSSIDMLKRLVAFDTTSRNSNLELIHYIRDYLADFGVESTLVPNARGHQGQPLRLDRPRPRRRRRAVGPHRRRAGRRPALDDRSVGPHREGRRQPLRPRHLRHEGLRRRLPRQRHRLPARQAQGADAFRLLLRRGDRLPGRACAGRAAGRRRAAAAGGDRGRADHDGRGQRAECRRRHRRHLHRLRSAFLDDPSRRQRHPLRRRLHPLAERAAGRAGRAQAHRHRHRARPYHHQCRRHQAAAPPATSWRASAP